MWVPFITHPALLIAFRLISSDWIPTTELQPRIIDRSVPMDFSVLKWRVQSVDHSEPRRLPEYFIVFIVWWVNMESDEEDVLATDAAYPVQGLDERLVKEFIPEQIAKWALPPGVNPVDAPVKPAVDPWVFFREVQRRSSYSDYPNLAVFTFTSFPCPFVMIVQYCFFFFILYLRWFSSLSC
jgi:hypothetical protein